MITDDSLPLCLCVFEVNDFAFPLCNSVSSVVKKGLTDDR